MPPEVVAKAFEPFFTTKAFGPLDTNNNDAAVASDSGIILVVEDEERVRKLSVESLLEHGFQVIEADNVNGRQLADEALRRRPNLKVLFTTGYSRVSVVQQGVLERGVHLLPKPFTVEELTSKVRRILGSGRG